MKPIFYIYCIIIGYFLWCLLFNNNHLITLSKQDGYDWEISSKYHSDGVTIDSIYPNDNILNVEYVHVTYKNIDQNDLHKFINMNLYKSYCYHVILDKDSMLIYNNKEVIGSIPYGNSPIDSLFIKDNE